MTIIKTKDFILRPLKLSDAKPYFEVMQDEETQRNFTTFPKTFAEAKEEIRQDLKEMKEKGSEYFTIEINGEYAGNVVLQHQNFDPQSGEGRVHLWIHPKFRGRGLATKALGELVNYGLKTKYKRIFAQCKAINKGVIKINKKLDFKKVKTHIVKDKYCPQGIKKILFVKEKPCYKCTVRSDLVMKTYIHWYVEVSDSPTPIGWLYIILNRHVEYFDELTDVELLELKKIIKELKEMLIKAFEPDWFNVMQLGNGGRHIHFHLVPRYKGKIKFDGKTFTDPDYGKMLNDRYKPYSNKKLLLKLRDYLKKSL